MEKKTAAEELLERALERVESASIRSWASSEHNRPLWLGVAERAIERGKDDPLRLATYIIVEAMGL